MKKSRFNETQIIGVLRNLNGSAARPLPPATEMSYQTQGLSQ